jgi:MFS family permease
MAGSIHIAMFIVGRILSGIGGGMLTSNCPVYLTEISPPHIRGMLTSVHGVAITLAYILSSLLALAFHFVEHSYQWRLPFVCYTSFGLLLPISLLALPESPRWLMVSTQYVYLRVLLISSQEQGRYKEAQSVLEHLHKSGSDSGHDISLEEYAQIKAQLDIERVWGSQIL